MLNIVNFVSKRAIFCIRRFLLISRVIRKGCIMDPIGNIQSLNPFVKSAGAVNRRPAGGAGAVGVGQPQEQTGLVDRLNQMGTGELKPAVAGSHLGNRFDMTM